MKKFFYLLPVVALLFAACSDDKDDNGFTGTKLTVKASEIKNAPSNDDVDEVRLVSYGDKKYTAATSNWDKGFEFELPETIPSNYLEDIDDFVSIPEGADIAISDKTARVVSADVEAYKANTYLERDFDLCYESDSEDVYVYIVYSNKDVTVKGTHTNEDNGNIYKYDVNLKKGWNRVAQKYSYKGDTYTSEMTSSIPNNVRWEYDGDY